MNGASPANESVNPWSRGELLPSVSPKYALLASLIALLCSLQLGLCGRIDWLAPILTVVLFVYVVFAVRSPAAVSTVILTSMPGILFGFEGTAVILSLCVGCMAVAYLITVLRISYLPLFLPVVGFAVSVAVSRDWQTSLLAFAFLPAAILLAVGTLRGRGRTSSICLAEAGFLLVLLAMLLVLVFRFTGGVGHEHIRSFINTARDNVTAVILAMRDELLAMVNTVNDESSKQLAQQISALYNENTVSLIFHLLPAVAVVICSILAFDAQMLLGMHYINSGYGAVVTREYRAFTMSITSAVLYMLAFLLSFFVSPLTMAGAVIQNLSIILLPGFLVLGVRSITISLSRARGGLRLFLILILAALFCCSSGGLSLIAAWGAYDCIMMAIQKRISEKLKETGDGGHMGGGDSNE